MSAKSASETQISSGRDRRRDRRRVVRSRPCTIQGWRPTSAAIQPQLDGEERQRAAETTSSHRSQRLFSSLPRQMQEHRQADDQHHEQARSDHEVVGLEGDLRAAAGRLAGTSVEPGRPRASGLLSSRRLSSFGIGDAGRPALPRRRRPSRRRRAARPASSCQEPLEGRHLDRLVLGHDLGAASGRAAAWRARRPGRRRAPTPMAASRTSTGACP